MPSSRHLARVAAAPLVAVAAFQMTLALGAPYGDLVLGGRASTTAAGALTPGFRSLAPLQGLLLLGLVWVLLLRGGIITVPRLSDRVLRRATWGVAWLMVGTTLGNLASTHPFERWVLGSVTLVVAVLSLALAWRGGDRREPGR